MNSKSIVSDAAMYAQRHKHTVAVIFFSEINDIIDIIIDKNFLPLVHETSQ